MPAAFLSMLLLVGASDAKATVRIVPPGDGSKTVKPRAFATAAFTAYSDADTSYSGKYKILVETDPGLALISKIEDIELPPGSSKKIPLTFSVSGDVDKNAALKAVVSIQSEPGTVESASATMSFLMDKSTCGRLENVPESLSGAVLSRVDVHLNITNCGEKETKFYTIVEAGNGLTVKEQPNSVIVKPGESAELKFITIPMKAGEDYESHLRIILKTEEEQIDGRAINFSVFKPLPPNPGDSARFLSMKMKLKYNVNDSGKKDSSLNIIVPKITDNTLSFKSEVWLQDNTGKVETKRQMYEIGRSGDKLTLGNQQLKTTEIVRVGSDFNGLALERQFGDAAFVVFSGDAGSGHAKMAKIDWKTGQRFSLRAGHIVSLRNLRYPDRLTTDTLSVNIKTNRKLAISAEGAATKLDGMFYSRSGAAFSLKGRYNIKKLELSALKQVGAKGFEGNNFQNAGEFDANFAFGKSRFFMSMKNRGSHSLVNDSSGAYSGFDQKGTANSLGWSRFSAKNGLTTSLSINRKTVADAYEADPEYNGNASQRSVKVSVGKQIESFNISVSGEIGKNHDMQGSSKLRGVDLAGSYEKNRVRARAGMTQSLEFSLLDDGTSVSRGIYADLEITPGEKNRSVRFGWRKDLNSAPFSARDESSRLFASLEWGIGRTGTLSLDYEIRSGSGARNDTLKTMYNKNIELKFPYRKSGSITGKVFIDLDQDGVFGSNDEPIGKAVVFLGAEYATLTSADGSFEIENIRPGKYPLKVDPKSFRTGITPAATGSALIKIKPGARKMSDIPFFIDRRIAGRIDVDSSGVIATWNKISPAGIRVVLRQNGKETAEAFTNSLGEYYFERLRPGDYEVAVDPEWLPKNTILKNTGSMSVSFKESSSQPASRSLRLASALTFDGGPVSELISPRTERTKPATAGDAAGNVVPTNINFSISPKEKPVVTTFKGKKS